MHTPGCRRLGYELCASTSASNHQRPRFIILTNPHGFWTCSFKLHHFPMHDSKKAREAATHGTTAGARGFTTNSHDVSSFNRVTFGGATSKLPPTPLCHGGGSSASRPASGKRGGSWWMGCAVCVMMMPYIFHPQQPGKTSQAQVSRPNVPRVKEQKVPQHDSDLGSFIPRGNSVCRLIYSTPPSLQFGSGQTQ